MNESLARSKPAVEPPPIPADARERSKIKTPPTIREPLPAGLKKTEPITTKEKKTVSRPAKTLVEIPPISVDARKTTPEVEESLKQAKEESKQALKEEADIHQIPSAQDIVKQKLKGGELNQALEKIAQDSDAAVDFLRNVAGFEPEAAQKVLARRDTRSQINYLKRVLEHNLPAIRSRIEREEAGRMDPREGTAPTEFEKRIADRLGITAAWKEKGQVVDKMSKEEIGQAFDEILSDPDKAVQFVAENTDQSEEEIKKELKKTNHIKQMVERLIKRANPESGYSPALRDMVSGIIEKAVGELERTMEREASRQEEKVAERKSYSGKEIDVGPIYEALVYVSRNYGMTPKEMRKIMDFGKLVEELRDLNEEERYQRLDDIFGKEKNKKAA